ncbi:hypothetical protein HYS82_02445 [Candidatus Amesbacteria bacterium]|nr:hypothetical protein [Candidatus Amesbacteria bacterium]
MKNLPLFLLTLFYSSTLLLLLPTPTPAQSCVGQDGTCPNPGTQSTCCAGFTCIGTGTQTIPGICKSTTNCGTDGHPCCLTGSPCQSPLTCNALNICANVGSPPAGTFTGFCPGGTSGIQTALGCLDITGKNTVSQILGWAVVVGGGIAFLLIVYAGIQMATASGDPKRVKASQELLTAALGGLILIVLSLVLLNFVGVKILNLGGLGFNVP